jgi:hypothetical protein
MREAETRIPYLSVGDVEGRNGLHAKLGRIGSGGVLGIVGPVEVLSRNGALAARHVTPDDEVGAPWNQIFPQ